MKVEIITFDADPDRGGFGTRVHSLVSMFSQFAEVRVVLTDWFRAPEIPRVKYEREPIKDSLRSKLRRLRNYYKTDFPKRRVRDTPDITIVESLDLVGLHQYGNEVPLVLDEHNVYWELLRYEMVNSPFFKTWLGKRARVRRWLIPYLLKRAKSFEVDAIRQATRTLVASESNRDLLLAELPELEGKIRVLPNCIDLERYPQLEDTHQGRSIVFIGNYNYVPNREAALYVSTVLAPALPEASFVLAGSDPPTGVSQAGNVVVTGYVHDLRPMLETAAVCIAPLTQGSGTRLKILTYLAFGKAVVATTKACEGLEVRDDVHLLIRDNLEGFRSAIRRLMSDTSLRQRLASGGRKLVETRYDWRVYVGWAKDFATEVQEATHTARAS